MGAESFRALQILSVSFKIIDTVECYNFRSHAITFTFFPSSYILINHHFYAFLSFLAGRGVDKEDFLYLGGFLKKNFKDTNRHGGKCVVSSLP